MKPTLFYSRLLPLTFVIFLLASVMCVHKDADSGMKLKVAGINDTLRVGNLAEAVRMTEELKSQALSAGDSATWSELMVQQGVNSYYQGNPQKLIASTDSAIKWLESQTPSAELARVLARAYQTHGAYYDQYNFNPDSTVYYLRKSVDNVESSRIKSDLPQAYGNFANAMRMAGSLDSAAIYYHRAISVADSLGLDDDNYIPLYNGMAGVFSDMHDFENSEIWWSKSMDILDAMNQFDKFNTLSGYGNLLYYSERYPEAELVFTRLREMLDSVPDSRWERMFTDVNLADIFINEGRPGDACEMLDSTAAYFTFEQPNPVALSYIHTLQMKSALADGDLEKAMAIASRHPDADTLRLEQRIARLKALEVLFSHVGNYQKAYESRRVYDNLNDSLRSYDLKHQISTLNAIYQRDRRILNLEAGNTRQKAHIYMLVAAVAFSIAILAVMVFIFVTRRIRSRLIEEKMMNKIISLRQENLRNRVTPHFIYNALNHELYNTSHGNPSHLDSLADLIRRQQLIASEMLIPFKDELRFVNDYIDVFGDNPMASLNYTFESDPDIGCDFLFPSMTLQILVENAFKHGFPRLAKDMERRLAISVRHAGGDRIAVSVFNNGHSPHVSDSSGTGLRVLVETIRLINERNKTDIQFSIDPDAMLEGECGYLAVITLSCDIKPCSC